MAAPERKKAKMLIDAHNDTAARLWREPSLRSLEGGANDFERLHRQLDIAFFAIFLDRSKYGSDAPLAGLALLERFLGDLEHNSDLIRPLLWREELFAKANALGAVIALEGAELLGQEAELLPLWRRLGLRSLGLTWNYRNQAADGCLEEGGLSRLGKALIQKCNALGVLVDAAHLARRGYFEVLELAAKPIIVSHAACRAVTEHRRNLDDRQLRALAAAGGVIGVTFVRDFTGGAAAGITNVVRHIVHAVAVAGIDCVGIGSDFDGALTAEGLQRIDDLPALWQALSQAGFNDKEIAKIGGGNICRVLAANLPAKPPYPAAREE